MAGKIATVATDIGSIAWCLRVRRDTFESVEKKAAKFLRDNYLDVRIEDPDGRIRPMSFIPAEK
jgi:hypothetical protein